MVRLSAGRNGRLVEVDECGAAHDQSVPGVFRESVGVLASAFGQDDSLKDGARPEKEPVVGAHPKMPDGVFEDGANIGIAKPISLIENLNVVRL